MSADRRPDIMSVVPTRVSLMSDRRVPRALDVEMAVAPTLADPGPRYDDIFNFVPSPSDEKHGDYETAAVFAILLAGLSGFIVGGALVGSVVWWLLS